MRVADVMALRGCLETATCFGSRCAADACEFFSHRLNAAAVIGPAAYAVRQLGRSGSRACYTGVLSDSESEPTYGFPLTGPTRTDMEEQLVSARLATCAEGRDMDRGLVTGIQNVTPYSAQFYAGQREGSRRSAERVVPLLVEMFAPKSVVDVGCGLGTWLSVFEECGVTDIEGYDGDWVALGDLRIDPDRFRAADLVQPLHYGRSFSLAVCLEVAEHLPSSAAPTIVDSLIRAAPVVVFSAAYPGQGGTDHVNEQALNYWTSLFSRYGWLQFDVLRPLFWSDKHIEAWYRRNLVIYCSPSASVVGQLRRRQFRLLPTRGFLAVALPTTIAKEKLRRKLRPRKAADS